MLKFAASVEDADILTHNFRKQKKQEKGWNIFISDNLKDVLQSISTKK